MRLQIANICLDIQNYAEEPEKLISSLLEHYKGFISEATPDIYIDYNIKYNEKIDVKENDIDSELPVNIIFQSNIYHIQGYNYIGIFNTLLLKAMILQNRMGLLDFDSFLRIILSLFLVSNEGFLLHSSGLVKDNKAYIFFGPSEAGKTTIVRLSNDKILLSDELVIIHKWDKQEQNDDRNFLAYGTPFRGELDINGINDGYEIAGLFLLHKDTKTFIKPKSKATAVFELMKNVLFLGRYIEKDVDTIFRISCDLIEKVSVYDLHFKIDNSFWEIIDEFIE